MDMDHIVLLKKRLESDISRLLIDFENVTQLEITDVNLFAVRDISGPNRIVSTNITVQLPS